MRMIYGSNHIISKNEKNSRRKGDVHVTFGQTLILAHGSYQYTKELLDNCFRMRNEILNPKDVLNNAYAESKVSGSSTFCMLNLNGQCLHAVNIGDNGFILLRDEEILYESPVQQHSYKIPYQLGNAQNANDAPEEIILTEIQPGDIIIAGSAGLFNNLFTHEIKDLVMKEIRKDPAPSPEMIAAEIAKTASERSINKCRFTPYSKAAWQAGKRHKGGKIGDITAIFAYILPN